MAISPVSASPPPAYKVAYDPSKPLSKQGNVSPAEKAREDKLTENASRPAYGKPGRVNITI